MAKRKSISVRAKLKALEAKYGQKEVARRLGVSPSTVRNWKQKNQVPRKQQAKKLNYVFGQNRKKIDYKEVVEYSEKTKKRQEARQEQLRKNPRLIATQKFVKNFDAEFIRVNLLQSAPPFIATIDGDRGQFITGFEKYGKPKGTKYVTLYGLYTNEYETNRMEGEAKEANTDLFITRFPLLAGMSQEWDLHKTLDYLETKFFETIKQVGKRKFNPVQFIGYELV